jgi:release factor glutamine methyltransferase
MMLEVLQHEPHAALFAGDSGMELYVRLIPQAARALRPGGYLVLELGYDGSERVRQLLSSAHWEQIEQHADLAGIVRVIAARRTKDWMASLAKF